MSAELNESLANTSVISGNASNTFQAVFLPRPLKLETVSHPVKAYQKSNVKYFCLLKCWAYTWLGNMFFLSQEKPPLNLTFSWKISYLIIRAAFANTVLFSIQELSHVSNKALPASPFSENNISWPFLLSHNSGIDSNKQFLNLVLWMHLSTPCATKTCSYKFWLNQWNNKRVRKWWYS